MFTSIDAVREVADPTARVSAASEYLSRLREREAEALKLRDDAIRASRASAPELARLSGLSVATIKVARRGRR